MSDEDVWTCGGCNNDWDGDRYCPKCGEESARCYHCQDGDGTDLYFCPECGCAACGYNERAYCHYCGGSVGN